MCKNGARSNVCEWDLFITVVLKKKALLWLRFQCVDVLLLCRIKAHYAVQCIPWTKSLYCGICQVYDSSQSLRALPERHVFYTFTACVQLCLAGRSWIGYPVGRIICCNLSLCDLAAAQLGTGRVGESMGGTAGGGGHTREGGIRSGLWRWENTNLFTLTTLPDMSRNVWGHSPWDYFLEISFFSHIV